MKRSFLVLWALVAVLACWRLDPVGRPITGDNQLYFYLAERAASGVPPHVSLVDTKGQLGVLLTAAGISAGRGAGVDDVLSSRAVSIAFAAASVVLAAELGALLTGASAAGHVAALAMLASRGFAEHAATGSNPKVFLAAFVLLAHVLAARRRPRRWADASAGMAAGAAFLCWQPALLVVAAVAFEALVGKGGSLRRLGVVVAAALVPIAGYELYFAISGALGEQLHQEYAMTLGSVHGPRRLVQSLFFVMTEARGMASPLRVAPVAFAILAAIALVRALREPHALRRDVEARPGALAFAAGAAAAVAFTIYDHQGVPDLFFVAPYFAVATGALAALVTGPPVARGAQAGRMRTAAALVLSALLALQMATDEPLRPRQAWNLADQRRAAEEVRGYARAAGGVWVYEAVHLLGLAHLDNHVSYGLFYDDVLGVLDPAVYLPLRGGLMPGVVVHGRRPIPGADRYLGADYEETTPAEFAGQLLRVWTRRTPQKGRGT